MMLSETAWIVILFTCVLLHEIAHSVLARQRGYAVREIVLMPLGGFSEIIGLSKKPRDEMTIALAGPLMNGVIAAILAVIAASQKMALWPPTLFAHGWLVRIVWANLMLAGLNLLPALPLDGGRVLRGYLARSTDPVRATAIAARISRTTAVLMIVIGVFADLWIAFIGFIVLMGARAEEQAALAGALLAGIKVRDVMVADPAGLQASESIDSIAPYLEQHARLAFPVRDGKTLIGIVSANDLSGHHGASTLRDVTDTLAPRLEVEDDLYPSAMDAFVESRRSSLAVQDHGQSVGVLYQSDVEDMMRRPPQTTR